LPHTVLRARASVRWGLPTSLRQPFGKYLIGIASSLIPPPCRWATQPGRTHTGDGETSPNPSSHAYPERCGTPDHSVDTVALEANASRSQSPTPSLATPSCGLLVGGPNLPARTTRTPTLSLGVGIPAISQEMVVTAHQLVTGVVEHAVFAGCFHYQTATRPHHGQEGIQSLSHQDGLRPHMVARVNMCGHSSNRVE